MSMMYDLGMMGDLMTPCTMLDQKSVTASDGQIGIGYKWEVGASFKASLIKNSATEAQIAESQGLRELYTVVVPKGISLKHQQVFRRDSDGATFRVTGDTIDSEAPDASTVPIAKVSAERWEVPAT